MAQAKFLVLGASSFYGSNFADLVESKGDIVIRLSRPQWQLGMPIPPADYAVNFAAASLVAESWERPEEWVYVNSQATTSLFEHARKHPYRKFIHVSTPEVYGSTRAWISEKYNFNPSTPYAVSRAAADMMLLAYHKAYGFPGIITRTANIYGEGQKEPRIIPLALRHKKEGKPLSLHGGGTSVRCFIHVKDACEATYLLCKEGVAGETYHISSNNGLSILSLVKMIGCEIGPDVPDRLGKDRSYLLDTSKIRSLRWHDKTRLAEWLKKNGV